MSQLRDYQQKASDGTFAAWEESPATLLVMPTGCLSGDSLIGLNRAGRGYARSIRSAFEAQTDRRTDRTIPTRIRSMVDNHVRLNSISGIVYSGPKNTSELLLENGYKLRATPDHLILTENGFTLLADLTGSHKVLCEVEEHQGKGPKKSYRQVQGLKYHRFANGVVSNRVRGNNTEGRLYRVPLHRLVVEAELNNMSTERLIEICRTDETRASMLVLLDPKEFAVHHRDGDHRHNVRENLVPMTHVEHWSLEGKDINWRNFGYGRLRSSAVKCVQAPSTEETFDVICQDPHRNFVANGIVVHNCGKTQVFTDVIRRMAPKRSMVLAHREELIWQARNRIEQMTGLSVDVEMADLRADKTLLGRPDVIVSTVQTQISGCDGKGRMSKFKPEDFGLLVIDEAHHCPAESYKKVIAYYRQNPDLKVLGVTATPDRADEAALGEVFSNVAFDYEILDAIHEGWLVPIDQQMVNVGNLDFSEIRTTAGDLNGADLAAVMESEGPVQSVIMATVEAMFKLPPNALAKIPVPQWWEACQAFGLDVPRRTLAFASSVRHAEMMAEILNRVHPGLATWICGATPKDERRLKLQDFDTGQTAAMINCAVLCLDAETEILTESGFVGIDAMTYQHRVANWDNGRVFFEEPRFIVRRDRLPDERMVVLETKNRSIRVTEDHRMLTKTGKTLTKWKLVHAGKLVGKKGFLPISGQAPPSTAVPEQEKKSSTPYRRQVVATSYNLRKKEGYMRAESVVEAWRRLDRRADLRYTTPGELTLEDCEFIGFWIGDGSRCHLQSGGVEYTLTQSSRCKNIVARVDEIIKACGFHSIKRTKLYPVVTKWSLPRGTGGGSQERPGLYRIEPYLDKNGSPLWWAFNEQQFDAFLRGYWMADGMEHRDRTTTPKNIRICGAREGLFNHIQAIACVRGYRVSLMKRPNGPYWLWHLSMTKKALHHMTKYTMRFEEGWKAERVWCVTSTTGNIITRRRGTVTVTGNTEGYDSPAVQVIVMARPTKSRALYSQMVGRSTRPLPGLVDPLPTADERKAAIAASLKPSCLVIDFVGNSGRHKLMSSADILGGKVSDEAIARAVKKAREEGKAVRMDELLDKSEEEIRAEIEERRQLEQARKARLVGKARYTTHAVNPFDVLQLQPVRERGWDAGKTLSEKQRSLLSKQGLDPNMPYAEGKAVIQELFRRWNGKLCTFRQAKILQKYGYDAKTVTMKEATMLIDQIAANNWRQPTDEQRDAFLERRRAIAKEPEEASAVPF